MCKSSFQIVISQLLQNIVYPLYIVYYYNFYMRFVVLTYRIPISTLSVICCKCVNVQHFRLSTAWMNWSSHKTHSTFSELILGIFQDGPTLPTNLKKWARTPDQFLKKKRARKFSKTIHMKSTTDVLYFTQKYSGKKQMSDKLWILN